MKALVLAGLALMGCIRPSGAVMPDWKAEARPVELLPAVVLLIAEREGRVTYGAGAVIDDAGTVLTSYHVISGAKTVRAFTYDPRSVGYTPLDGGLTRFLEENAARAVPVEL